MFAKVKEKRYKTKTYGEGLVHVTAQTFRKREDELPEIVIDKDGIEPTTVLCHVIHQPRQVSNRRHNFGY